MAKCTDCGKKLNPLRTGGLCATCIQEALKNIRRQGKPKPPKK